MLKSFCAVAALATAISTVGAAPSVAFTNVLDTNVVSQAYSASYDPVSDNFLVSGATDINRFNGTTGAANGALDKTGISPSGLGFFAVTASGLGKIYAVEIGGANIWRWNSSADTSPQNVYNGVLFSRVGSTGGNSVNPVTNVAFTGSANNGPVQFFQDDGTTFTGVTTESMTAKSALTINAAATIAFTTGDTGGQPINKWEKIAGVWTQDTTTWLPTQGGAGPMAYDEVNNVLFIHPEFGGGTNVYALHGTTGETIGTATTTNALNGTAGYNGAYVASTLQAGSLWMAGRLAGGSTNAALYKWTYVYTPDAAVKDWSVY